MISLKTTKFNFQTSKLSLNSDNLNTNSSTISTCVININNTSSHSSISVNNLAFMRRNSLNNNNETIIQYNSFQTNFIQMKQSKMYMKVNLSSNDLNQTHKTIREIQINETPAPRVVTHKNRHVILRENLQKKTRKFLSTASIYVNDETPMTKTNKLSKFISSLTHSSESNIINRFGKYLLFVLIFACARIKVHISWL